MLNVAIIGAGVWSENHRTGWNACDKARIACVVRSSAAAAEETARRWGVPAWDDDYRRVLQRDDIDIVDILLPHHLHVDVAVAALEHGKHVLMEKPLAITLGDAQRLVDAGQHADRKVMIAENWDYATVVRWAKERIDSGDIGAPFLIRTTLEMDVRGGFSNLRWRHDAESMGGGALLDAGTHPVSACRYLLGEIVEVGAFVESVGFEAIRPLEDTTLLLLRFASGAVGSLIVSWTAQRERPRSEFTILGSAGTIEFDTHGRSVFFTRDGGRTEQFLPAASRGFVEQVAHFIDCIALDRTPLTSPQEQLGSLKTVLAAYRSARERRFIRLSEL